MKKILSLVCAIVLAFGVNAAPQLHQLGAKSQETLKAEALARIDTHAKKYASKMTAAPQRAHKAVAVTPIDTMEVELNNIEIIDATDELEEPWFQIVGSNVDFPGDVYVCVNSASIAGTFTAADIDFEYTGLWLDDENCVVIVDGDGIVEVIETNKVFSFYLFDEEGHGYHVYGEDKAPIAEETVDFIATDLEIDDSYFDLFYEWFGVGLFDIYATDNNGLDLAISVEADKINGTFTEAEFSGSIGNASIYSGEITVNKEAMTVTGTVLCKNNVQYNLNLSYVKPEKTRERTLTAKGGEFADLTASYGAWEALYESDSIILQLAMFADEIAGDYTIADNYGKGYSFFAEVNGNDTIWDLLVDANFNVAVNLEDSLVTITGVLLGQNNVDLTDVPELTVNLVMPLIAQEEEQGYEYDEENDPFNVNFAASEVDIDEQWFADYGDIMVYGENAAGEKIIVDVYDYGYADGVFTPGTYNIDLSFADGTVAAGYNEDGYLIPSIAGTVDAQGYFDKVWYLVSGIVTISEEAIVVDAINSYGLSIKSTLSLTGTAVENIEAGEQSINKTLRNGQVLIQKNNKTYTVLGQEVK